MNWLRWDRDIAPGQTRWLAISGISVSTVSWPSLLTIACLKLAWIGASGVAINRVPSNTPSAPRARAAARPRPLAIPPADSTGNGDTALTIIGTSGNDAIQP